ncbi:helix-turn-helix domain-containing protein [Fructobacillus tropaeoli]|uniref:helix-turn-helix domain-containing protein n=1 Tax=Fructobacillus tropaeoli TaxID=709323 RepID=UPI003BABD486
MADKLRSVRKERQMSLTDLVISTGVSRTQLIRFYTSDRRTFTDETFEKLWRFAYYDD